MASWQWRPHRDSHLFPGFASPHEAGGFLPEAISQSCCNFVPQRSDATLGPHRCVRGHCTEGGRLMFEQNQKEIESLMQSNAEFRSLYQRHKELDGKVRDAELGVLPMDDVTLLNMKKEKLHAKDKLTHMWESSADAAG
jgi:uncharacterized protein YdcH (DUF465 family)